MISKDQIKFLRERFPAQRAVVGVMGGTGAGKTTICNKLAELGETVLFPGQLVRKMVTPSADSAEMAPASTEKLVRNLIEEVVTGSWPKAVFIDGFPRSVSQFYWGLELAAGLGGEFWVMGVEANKSVRRLRLKAREKDAYDADLWEKRLDREDGGLPLLMITVHDRLENGFVTVANGIA